MADPAPTPYRVLARKYRPQTFAQMIGQEALVRTLSNAIQSGRLAHAFLLTGVRGVGKTTTARIIARPVNFIGPVSCFAFTRKRVRYTFHSLSTFFTRRHL